MGYRLKYLQAYRDRHGKPRFYLRRRGQPLVSLPGLPGSVEFLAAYSQALAGDTAIVSTIGLSRSPRGSVAEAIGLWLASPQFTRRPDGTPLAEDTMRTRLVILEKFRREHGEKLLAGLTRTKLKEEILFSMTPSNQSNLMKAFRPFITWAIKEKLIGADNDPTLAVKTAPLPKTDGYYSWTDEDMKQWLMVHSLGTRERVAYAICHYLGLRRSDAVRLGPQHITKPDKTAPHGRLNKFVVQKTKNSSRIVLTTPIHPALDAAFKAHNSGHLTFLAQTDGSPLNPQGLSRLFERAAAKAGLPGRSAHGLRKGLGRRIAEAGGEVPEIMNALGHTDPRTATIYWKAARSSLMGDKTMARLLDELDEQCMRAA